jgi:asparagine synthase (glutamine-hydrolysing)
MCGIAAILSFENKSVINKPALEKMTKAINHRGPDDEGFYLNDWVGFGFKRLSILDISYDGHQPMFDLNNNYVIVFNGEIYNYKIIKEELIKKHYKFKSATDTEVLLNSFIEWNVSCLDKLEGMFAFIIYDKIKDEVLVARDHLGIKPLYFFENNNCYFFGSEIKAFESFIEFELNEKQLYEQFVYGYVSGKNTIFQNIYRVKPGTYMKFNRGGLISENQYYDVTSSLNNPIVMDINYDEIKSAISESISRHTMSDVGYNVQLSGGIDSSYITAVLSKDFDQRLNTYSVTLEKFNRDESRYQNLVSEKYNTNHHSFSLTGKDMCDNFEKATWYYDIPQVHLSSIFLMVLCGHSKQSSKVILTGEGSDELFGGYNSFSNTKLYKYNLIYFLQKHDMLQKLILVSPLFRKIRNSLENFNVGIDQSSFYPREIYNFTFNHLREEIEYRNSVVENIKELPNKIFASFQTSYLNFLFERQDKMSMAMGVEARVPFSNRLLFDKINRIHFNKKIKPVPKAILKKLSEEYFDDSFIYRDKIGFALPIDKWLREENSLKQMLDLLTDKTFRERGFYNHRNIDSLIENHLNGNKDYSKYLMNIINFEVWHRIFIDKQLFKSRID